MTPDENRSRFGSFTLLLVAILYGTYGIFYRALGSSFESFTQNWLRSGFVLIIALVIFVLSKQHLKKIEKTDIKWVILWLLGSSWNINVLSFISFNHLPIGTAYLLIYTAMILAGYFTGNLFFKEKFTFAKVASLMLALLGISVVFRFSITVQTLPYLFTCLAGGVLTGFWNTISKKFSHKYPSLQLVMLDALLSIVAGILISAFLKETSVWAAPPQAWGILVLYAICQTATIGLLIVGFRYVQAQIGSIILAVEIVFAIIFAYLFFGEVPGVPSIIGGVLILAAAIIPYLNFRKNHNTLSTPTQTT